MVLAAANHLVNDVMSKNMPSNESLSSRLAELLPRYATSGPRYTSYPTVPEWQSWSEASDRHRWQGLIQDTNAPLENGDLRPLSIYLHIPFCESRCLFCGCNVVITKQKPQAQKYLDALYHEIDGTLPLLDLKRPVRQLHWGGGTPTYLSARQLQDLGQFLSDRFTLDAQAEIALEVDPRVTTLEQLEVLRGLGFNRLSMGVQDFNPEVQKAIHREQSLQETQSLVEAARHLGYGGINLDLIYGLPHQTLNSFQRTVDEVIALSPDRIALYHFAYVPWLAPHQKQMPEETLPTSDTKLAIFCDAMARLTAAGYVYIGMDHFAKPTDDLALALSDGRLHRNFMGYTSYPKVSQLNVGDTDPTMISLGVSSISDTATGYAQNARKLSDYYDLVAERKLPPVQRGMLLNDDDHLRRWVIQQLLCQGHLSPEKAHMRFPWLERAGGFDHYFAEALSALQPAMADDLIGWDSISGERQLVVSPLGRVFSRNLAMAFDAYLKPANSSPRSPKEAAPKFSQTA
jgi:oxygen-independent coproporphyrinogen-3 oxidase